MKRIAGLRLNHVGWWTVIEVNSFDMVLQVCVLQNHCVEVHLVVLDSAREFFHGVLARLILLLDSDYDPVIQYIEHLECLARNLVQDESRPSEEKVQSH